jgi:hypothetical protein
MDLGRFALAEPALREWLAAERLGREKTLSYDGEWSPIDPGAEDEVIELIAAAQKAGHLTGPGEAHLLYSEAVDVDWFTIMVDLPHPDDRRMRLSGDAAYWETINPEGGVGIDAAVAVLEQVVDGANAVLRTLEEFAAPHESAAYDQALEDSLDVTEGIEEHGVCGCGEPIALYDGRWMHVYNDELRGTDDHTASP